MIRLELTCDLCGLVEHAAWEPRAGDPPKGWHRAVRKGEDLDICPVCWNRILAAVADELPPKPEPERRQPR
jgi:hypothetical protein